MNCVRVKGTLKACRHVQDDLLKFKLSVSECGIAIKSTWVGLSIQNC